MTVLVLYSSRLPWRAVKVAEQLRAAIEEDRGGEGLSGANFRLLASYGVPDWATDVAVEPRGLRWNVVPIGEI